MRRVEGDQSIAAAAHTLVVVAQTLFNQVKAHRVGKLSGVDCKVVSAEQMEISRLRAELARVMMERKRRGLCPCDAQGMRGSRHRGTSVR